MPDPRLVSRMQREGIEEAFDIVEASGYGELEHFGHVRHPATADALKTGVVAGVLARMVRDLSKRVEELEAKANAPEEKPAKASPSKTSSSKSKSKGSKSS